MFREFVPAALQTVGQNGKRPNPAIYLDDADLVNDGVSSSSTRDVDWESTRGPRVHFRPGEPNVLEFKDFIEIKDPEPRSPALSGSITWTCVHAK